MAQTVRRIGSPISGILKCTMLRTMLLGLIVVCCFHLVPERAHAQFTLKPASRTIVVENDTTLLIGIQIDSNKTDSLRMRLVALTSPGFALLTKPSLRISQDSGSTLYAAIKFTTNANDTGRSLFIVSYWNKFDTIEFIGYDSSKSFRPLALPRSLRLNTLGLNEVCTTLSVRNTSQDTARLLDTLTIVGLPEGFQVSSLPAGSRIAPGALLNASICFTPPDSLSIRSTTLRLRYLVGKDTLVSLAQLTGRGSGCVITLEDTIDIGTVVKGATVALPITLKNQSKSQTQVSVFSTHDSIVVLSNFGFLDSLTERKDTLHLQINAIQAFVTILNIAPPGCMPHELVIHGDVAQDLENVTLSLAAPQRQTIGMRSSDTDFASVDLVNDFADTITITNLQLDARRSFYLDSLIPLPLSLAPNAKVSFRVVFVGDTIGTHEDQIVVGVDKELPTGVIAVQAVKFTAPSNGVPPETQKTVTVRLVPNPARDRVNVQMDGCLVRRCTVYDLLGREVVVSNTASQDGLALRDASGRSLAAGMYYLRVEGLDESGVFFVATSQLVVK